MTSDLSMLFLYEICKTVIKHSMLSRKASKIVLCIYIWKWKPHTCNVLIANYSRFTSSVSTAYRGKKWTFSFSKEADPLHFYVEANPTELSGNHSKVNGNRITVKLHIIPLWEKIIKIILRTTEFTYQKGMLVATI